MSPLPPHPPLPSDRPHPSVQVFRARRERLLERVGDAVVVLPGAPQLYRSRDTEVLYRPDGNLYYLTGFQEPGAVAVLTPHGEARFTLFVRPRDAEREAWSGRRAGVEGAVEHFGADAAYPLEELPRRLRDLVEPADRILHPLGVDPSLDASLTALIQEFRRTRQRSGRGPSVIEDVEPVVAAMRLVKEPAELEVMRSAGAMAAEAHRSVMAAARPGVGEWELHGVLESTLRRLGAAGPSFPPIVASGPNATVLHYVTNDRRVAEGDLVLVDAGAEYGMYVSDISRTLPASGRFTPGQRALYEVVLEAEEAAIAAVRPGGTVAEVHDAAVRVLTEGMVALGLLEGPVDALIEQGGYRRFYLHQTSHWLGLDVHDVGQYRDAAGPVPLQPGMVLTVEPGLYIRTDAADVPEEFRGVGVRIEDDVLVTVGGRELLTRGVPVAPEAVEAIVQAGAAAG
jgi:Xaa-Pro aminopeptidase